MIELRCAGCRLVWREDRDRGDSPVHPQAFCCPRCGNASRDPKRIEPEQD